MPIGSLLAEITGEKPKTSSAGIRPSLPPKRKAEDDLKAPTGKVPRTTPIISGSQLSSPRPTVAAPLSSAPKPSSLSSAPAPSRSYGNPSAKPSIPARTRPPTKGNGVSTGPKPTGSLSSSGTAADVRNGSPAPVKAAPKKGSFAEIMARAAAGQKSLGQVGKIQHKPIDKVPSKREREELKAELARGPKGSSRNGDRRPAVGGTVRQGSGVHGVHGASLGARHVDRSREVVRRPGGGDARASLATKREAEAESKRPKKAAVATTGYQGTARPPPGADKAAASKAMGESNSHRPDRPRLPFGASRDRGRRDDYYDPDMDDFIDDDDEIDEEDTRGHHYSYASEDDESDMEAGLSDIEEEDRRTEYLGRREDQVEEAREKRLKREKEERKRRMMEAAAGKRR